MKTVKKILLAVLTLTALSMFTLAAACSGGTTADPNAGHTHDYVWVTASAPTCKQAGKEVYKCSYCGDIKEERETEKSAHVYNGWTADEGEHAHVCLVCGEKVDAAAHSFDWTASVAADCVSGGKESYACTVCGYVKDSRDSVASEHVYGEWQSNGPEHFRICTVGREMDRGAHTVNDEGVCTVCGLDVGYVSNEADYETTEDENGNITITKYNGTDSLVAIPSAIGGKPVVAIGTDAFRANMDITSVIVPVGVTSVAIRAFYSAQNLASISLPEGLATLGTSSLTDTAVTSLVVPSTITSFMGVPKSLTSIVFADGIETIDTTAFDGMTNLRSITLPTSIKAINAFGGCTMLEAIYFNGSADELRACDATLTCSRHGSNSDVILDYKLTNKDIYCFSHKQTLETGCWSYNADGSVAVSLYPATDVVLYHDTLGGELWAQNYTGFGGHVEIPAERSHLKVTHIANFAFCGMITNVGNFTNKLRITSITIPDTVVGIGTYAFAYIDLESIHIPDSVKEIREYDYEWNVEAHYVFYQCDKLRSVTGMRGLDYLPTHIFQGCTSLESIELSYGIRQINDGAFSGCTSLKSVILPETLKILAPSVFWDCSSLETIKLPDSIVTVGEDLFRDCTSLRYVELSANMRTLSKRMFAGCHSLETLVMPASINYFGTEVFGAGNRTTSSQLATLENVYFRGTPEEWLNIYKLSSAPQRFLARANVYYYSEDYAEGCWHYAGGDYTSASVWSEADRYDVPFTFSEVNGGYAVDGYKGGNTTVMIPAEHEGKPVVAIADKAFYGKNFIENVNIPSSVTKIGKYAFAGTSLKAVKLPDSVVSVGKYAFADCPMLTAFCTGDAISALPEGMLMNDISLVTVEMGENVTSLGRFLLAGCTKLDRAVIPASVTGELSYLFTGDSALRYLTIGGGSVLGAGNLKGLNKLEWVVISNSITKFADSAFDGLGNAPVYYEGTAADWNGITNRTALPSGINPVFYSDRDTMEIGCWGWNFAGTAPLYWDESKLHTVETNLAHPYLIYTEESETTKTRVLHEDDVIVIEYHVYYNKEYDKNDWPIIYMEVTTDGGEKVRYDDNYHDQKVGLSGDAVTNTATGGFFSNENASKHPKLYSDPAGFHKGDAFVVYVTMRGDGQVLHYEVNREAPHAI